MASLSRPSEFDFIKKYMRPLSKKESGGGLLLDDAAVLSTKEKQSLVVTMDTLVSGVHFLETTPPEFIASKILRVNLSDLAAMGANPEYYTLSISIPSNYRSFNEDWFKVFSSTLKQEQNTYGITLVGGDTVSTPGPLSLTITAFGSVKPGRALLRSKAIDGDIIFVSGFIGDAWLGLAILRGEKMNIDPSSINYVKKRYYQPTPRVNLGQQLFGLANSAIDVSDGLIQDLKHICNASKVSAFVNINDIPLSKALRPLIKRDSDLIKKAIAGGDDYELLFTAPPLHHRKISKLAETLDIPLTTIGQIIPFDKNKTVTLLDKNGVELKLKTDGFQHF